MKRLFLTADELKMNPMYIDEPLGRLWSEKNIFFLAGCLFSYIWFIHVHRTCILTVFGLFLVISFILLLIWMNQMYIDEPLSSFRRFFAFGNLTDEPLGSGKVHPCTFGSLRNGGEA